MAAATSVNDTDAVSARVNQAASAVEPPGSITRGAVGWSTVTSKIARTVCQSIG